LLRLCGRTDLVVNLFLSFLGVFAPLREYFGLLSSCLTH